MNITRENLLQQRKVLEARRLEGLQMVNQGNALANQCIGAIAMVDALLKAADEKPKDDAMSLEQVKEMLGAESVELVANGHDAEAQPVA
jgi:hypothetical protein